MRVFETMAGKTNAFQRQKQKETTVRAEVSQLCRAVGRTCFIFSSRKERERKKNYKWPNDHSAKWRVL